MDIGIISQVMLFVLSLSSAILLTGSRTKRGVLVGCLCGLCSEPFWMISAWLANNWAIMGMALVYSVVYARGSYFAFKQLGE